MHLKLVDIFGSMDLSVYLIVVTIVILLNSNVTWYSFTLYHSIFIVCVCARVRVHACVRMRACVHVW